MRYLFLIILILVSNATLAETLKEQLRKLKPLEIQYGANYFTINNSEIIITHGRLKSGTAWDGEAYSVFIKEDEHFQMARFRTDNHIDNEVIIWALPHTEEDAISAVRFFSSSDLKHLYILKSHREWKDTVGDEAICIFTLYRMDLEEDFGIYYFNKIDSMSSVRKYLDVVEGMESELGIK